MSNANFSPDIHEKKPLGAFRFWCQKVLPLTYDDSLSYYELLNKVVYILNDVIENQRLEGEDIDAIATSYNELQDYVNNYFNNLDVQDEINNKLDALVSDGTMTELLQPIFDAYSANMTARVVGVEEDIQLVNGRIDEALDGLTVDSETEDIRVGTIIRRGSGSTTYQNIYPSAGDAVRMQLDNMLWNISKTRIGGTDGVYDLNDYTTPGNYCILDTADVDKVVGGVAVRSISNFPNGEVDKACMIKVISYATPKNTDTHPETLPSYTQEYTYPMQICIAWDASYAYARTYNTAGSTWLPWRSLNWNECVSLLDDGIRLGETATDLDDITTCGNYYIMRDGDTANVANLPYNKSGIIKVMNAIGKDDPSHVGEIYRTQLYISWDSNHIAVRSIKDTHGAWGAWKTLTFEKAFALLEGGTRIGASAVNADTLKTVGNYYIMTDGNAANVANLPVKKSGILKVTNAIGVDDSNHPTEKWRVQAYISWDSNDIYVRSVMTTDGVFGSWKKIRSGNPEDQKTSNIVANNAKSTGGGTYYPYQYLADGTINPGYQIGVITDIHGIDGAELDNLLDYFCNDDSIIAVLNLGDTAFNVGSETTDAYVEKIYTKLFNAGKGYIPLLGNHDVVNLTGQQAVNRFLNGTNNAILTSQPTSTSIKMGFVRDVVNGEILYCDSEHYNDVASAVGRVYMIEATYRGSRKSYMPIYCGCAYNLSANSVISTDTSVHPGISGNMDNGVAIFSKVCNFFATTNNYHSPWIFAMHETHIPRKGDWQKINVFKDIYASDFNGETTGTTPYIDPTDNRPYWFYLTPFTSGGENWENYIMNFGHYGSCTRFLEALETGTAGTSLTFHRTANGDENPDADITFTDLTAYSALNDVAIWISGHQHFDTEYSLKKGFDSWFVTRYAELNPEEDPLTAYPDVSASCAVMVTNCDREVLNFSDIIYDRNDPYYGNTFTTLAVAPRHFTSGTPDTAKVAYVMQRFGAQNTCGGIKRTKLIYSRDKSGV